jgi:hypothetical protein
MSQPAYNVRFYARYGGGVLLRGYGHPEALVITHKSGALRLARLFGKLAYHPEGGKALT